MQSATILLVHLNVIVYLVTLVMDVTVQVNSSMNIILQKNTFEKLKKEKNWVYF
jgi:membrane associated rhomboid family serine protease